MNNFFFFKKPEAGFSTDQLKGIHNNLRNLGYEKDFSGFYSELAALCEHHEDCPLTSKKVAPIISDHIFSLLEKHGQPDIRGKVFALASIQKREQTQLYVPTIHFTKQSVLDFLKETSPELLVYVENLREVAYLPGFASPVSEKSESSTHHPKEEKVTGLSISSKQKTVLRAGREETVSEVQKISLTVTSDNVSYELPIYLTQDISGAIETIFEEKEGVLLSERKDFLSLMEYREEWETYLGKLYENRLRLP